MLNTKEYFNQLDAITVTEIDSETAAAIQGGAALEVYRHAGQKDLLGSFNSRSGPTLSSNANNQISSVKVNSGVWRLYDLSNWKGAYVEFSKGKHNVPAWFNDRTTSLQKVG